MRKLFIPIIIILLLAIAGFAYWYFFFHGPGGVTTTQTTTKSGAFSPFGRILPSNSASTSTTSSGSDNAGGGAFTVGKTNGPVSALRMLSSTPVGGYSASTTAIGSVVRFVDRGRGNVSEFPLTAAGPTTLSNTILPRIYESVWNKNLTAFIGSMLPDKEDVPTIVYAELRPNTSTSTASSADNQVTPAPYVLRGNNLPKSIASYAISPKGDKVFIFSIEDGSGVGYIANFNGTGMTRIFTTPITQVNVEWPETSTITITTKGTASGAGFLYFVSPKTGTWSKVLGPLNGLSTRTSHDAKHVLYSYSDGGQYLLTYVYDTRKGTTLDAVIRTLADKCAWGNFYADIIYCGVPSEPVSAVYPDDWYRGNISFSDKIWQVNTTSGEVHLISSIVDSADRIIDAYNISLDAKDNYLFFMNKNDLSLWSLNLVTSASQ